MATVLKRLSARFVDTVTAAGFHADGDGLYLSVSPKGAKRWVLVYFSKAAGNSQRRREMSLGGLSVLTLAEARDAAQQARRDLARGLDPIDARKAAAEQAQFAAAAAALAPLRMFGAFAESLLGDLASGFRNDKHIAQWRMSLSLERSEAGEWKDTGYCLTLRHKPLDTISTNDVLAVLRPIWQTLPETASRVRGRIERVLDAAKARGLREGENPARWRGHLDAILPKRQKLTRGHHAAMPFGDVPALVLKLRQSEGMGAKALEFLILCASRSGEVLGARWPEIDMASKVWTVPAERMKAGREHRVPLTARALEILQPLYEGRTSELVFPGIRKDAPMSSMTLAKALKTAGAGGFTVHGFRSSFRDWAGEATEFPDSLAEHALAHVVGDATVRAYRRGDALDRRRTMMEAWADLLSPS
jgi:integrase